MAKREKLKKYTTGIGRFIWPRFFTPDTKFKKEGQYGTRFAQSPTAAAALVKQIDEAITASVAATKEELRQKDPTSKKAPKRADAPYKIDEETGDVVFNFKMSASGVYKTGPNAGQEWTRKPTVFDAAGRVLGPESKVGGGSEGQVSFTISPFYTALVGAGVSLRLEAARITKLVEWGGGDAKSFGFEVEEAEPEAAAETEDVAEGEF